MSPAPTILALGELRPQPPASMKSHSASGRPPQLDDRDWLARRYAQDGDMAIALELGCTRLTVRRARVRLGITSASAGRRRGRTPQVAAVPNEHHIAGRAGTVTLTGTAAQLLDRFQTESRTGGPAATKELLVARLHALHDADQNGDQLAYEDGLLAIASAAGLIHQHAQRLRRAA